MLNIKNIASSILPGSTERKKEKAKEAPHRSLLDDIIHTADNFAENFHENPAFTFVEKGTLDYSIESLSAVDDLLEELSDFEWNKEQLYNITSMIGCYIFETARRNYGGEYFWLEKEQQPVLIAGLPDFRVQMKVWEKVRGRVLNGREDNIPFFIAGYKEYIERAKEGDVFTIV